jgi:RNA polymerase sigma factor (sigma-70 family)
MKGEDIIAKLKRGDSEELKKIYEEYRIEFLKWVMKKFNFGLDEAKDIYQYAVVELYENVLNGKLVNLSSSIKTYLFAIGKYKALDHFKKQSAKTGNFDFSSYFDKYDQWSDGNENGLEDKINTLEAGILQIGNPCKSILEHYYYYKKKSEEIAKLMGYKNSDTVKNLRHKCLKRLRKFFYSNIRQIQGTDEIIPKKYL